LLAAAPLLFGFLFTTPLAAFLVAAGAVSIPIAIHLLNRRRYRVIVWAAMRFLLAAQKKNTRRMRLEQLLLLAVRSLLVLFLVLAMASVMPWSDEFWSRLFPERAIRAAAGSRRTHKIVVLDGSFSMATRIGDATCFQRAQSLGRQIVQESPSGDAFSVVLMAAPPRRVVPEPSEDAARVADEIGAVRLPHGNADLTGTFAAVEDLLRHSPGKFEEREVYFLTDLQRSTWMARQSASAQFAGLLQKIQSHARTVFIDVGQDGIANTAVTNLTLSAPYATTGAVIPVIATVHNFGSEPRRQVRIALLTGRARSAAGDPPFALQARAELLADLAPGANVINFPCRFSTPGEYALQVHVESDALDVDDTRTAVVTVKDSVPVMLVNGKPAAEVYDRATEWLTDALNPFQSGHAPGNVPARPKTVTESQFADAALGDLTPYDCVFFCDVARLDGNEIRRLEAHLRSGGGAVFCLGPHVDLEAYNRLLHRNGEGILPARLMGIQATPDKRFFNLFADEKQFHEPPLDAFGAERDRLSLLSARFRQYVRAELPPGRARKLLSFMPETSVSSSAAPEHGTPLPIGEAALLDSAYLRGRVVVFTSTVNMDWNTWPISPSFPAFMQELLRYAVAGRLREHAAVAGETLEAVLQPGNVGLDASIATPDGRIEKTQTTTQDDLGVLRWTDTEVSGLYRATLGHSPQDYLFAVNVPTATEAQQSSESDLARTNCDELQAAYPGWEFQFVSNPHDVSHSGGPIEADTEQPIRGMGRVLAHWLLLGMLVLLILEVILAWRFGHYTAVASEVPPASGRALPVTVAVTVGLLIVALVGILAHAAWTGDFLGFLSDDFRAAVEARLGIPPPAPGEGTRWHLEFTPYFWDAAADPWLAGGLALALAASVVAIYIREGHTASRAYKLLLAGLRFVLILVTLAVLLPQVRIRFERQGWPDLAIVIDDSRSMSTTDQYQDAATLEAAERLAKVAGLSKTDRLQLAQVLLTSEQHQWLESLLTHQRVKLHVYNCSGRAARVADVTEAAQIPTAAAAIRTLQADGPSSQLGTAVRQVLNDFRGSSLSAVIMLTDGVTTEGEDLVKVSRYAAQAGVPLFFVGLGDAHEVRDLVLHDLQVDDTVYVNDHLVFEARLTAQGYPEPRPVVVTLYEKDKDGKLKSLESQRVVTDPQGKPVKFRIVHQPTTSGEKTYVLDVPVQSDEVKPADNNRLERDIFVREAKLIKLLYVEGTARYEYRFVKNLLERESDREVGNRSIDLHVLLLDADPEYANEDKSALPDFPTKEELNGYDVVILGDVDPKDPKLGPRNLQNLAEFVTQRGGGLLMIAGPNFSPHAYKDSPLADVLPIEVTGPPQPEREYLRSFRPGLTAIGRFHPIFRFSPDEAENQTIWTHLAEIYWWSEGYVPKPAAETLLVHPDVKSVARRPGPQGDTGHPLLVQQFVGAGRSMFLGFDETWRWRLREYELRFNQFWIQMIRYLARSRLGRIELHVDRETPYRRGEPIRVTVRFPDDQPPPRPETKVEVMVTRSPLRPSGTSGRPTTPTEKETLPLTKVEGSRATYEGVLTRTPEGEYHFWLASPLVSGPKPRAEARTLPPPGEMEQLRMNQPDLERAALETHGKFYALADADRLLDELPPGTRVSLNTPQPPILLWNHGALFGLALGLLTTEWLLRKRKYLL
jgi:Aerotolerance regulator N-terminal/von Willebrand factor type A domain